MSYRNNGGNDFWDLKKMMGERKAPLADNNDKTQVAPSMPGQKETHREVRPRTLSLSRVDDIYMGSDAAVSNKREYSPEQLPRFKNTAEKQSVAVYSHRPLILDVKHTPASQGFSSSFMRLAEKYWDYDAQETPFTDFYAYSPTYSNFTVQSFKYYAWWRRNFRDGINLKASWSYISVFISEIINCPHLVSSEEGTVLLWRLFEAYSDVGSPVYLNDVLCKLPEIICDYSLINSVGIPESVGFDVIERAVKNARLREVFFEDRDEVLFCKLLISTCSEYEFSKSKFFEEIFKEENEKYIISALLACIDTAKKEGLEHPLAGDIKEVTTVSRHSYSNYVYVSPEKLCVLTVGFCSVNRSYTLRNSISGIVKQCENNIRAVNGIKPRLKVFSLEPIFRDTVDSFFEKLFPPQKRKKIPKRSKEESDVPPEYERFYENEREHEFSLENAKRIEERSWDVVQKLVDSAEADNAMGKPTVAPSEMKDAAPTRMEETAGMTLTVDKNEAKEYLEKVESPECSDELSEILSVCPECKELVFALYEHNLPKAKKCARELDVPIQVLCDRINEISFDVIGDMLIDTDGENFEIIEDYEYIFDSEN